MVDLFMHVVCIKSPKIEKRSLVAMKMHGAQVREFGSKQQERTQNMVLLLRDQGSMARMGMRHSQE